MKEASKAIGCPPDSIGLTVLVALGGAIGNSRVVQPKKDWKESAAIFGAVVAPAGEKKTAAVRIATGPARKAEGDSYREYEKKHKEYLEELRKYETDKKKAAKGEDVGPPPEAPVATRVRINDATVEALIPILKNNPRGVLKEHDELVAWVKSMDQYKSGKKGSERQFWLSTWSNEEVSVDRKGEEGTTKVDKPFVGVIGSIQPDVLPELTENREDGMLERFLFAYPKPINAEWTEDEISDEALEAYHDLYKLLRNLVMGTDDHGEPMYKAVTFAPDAKAAYIQHYNAHRKQMRAAGFPSYLNSVWSKLEAYTLRITLVIACSRFAGKRKGERVELDDLKKAIALTEYFKTQARRVFGSLRGFDRKKLLLEDVAQFVEEQGGTWEGTPTELHQQFQSNLKPERTDELSKFVKEAAKDEPSFTYTNVSKRWGEDLKVQRVLTLSLLGNGVNG